MADITSIPPKTDALWRAIALGKIVKPWQSLALKIMITRIARAVQSDPSEAMLQKSAEEIHDFFEKNMKTAQADLHALFD